MIKEEIKPFFSFKKLNGERGFSRNWSDVVSHIGNKTNRCERLDKYTADELTSFLDVVEGWTEDDKNILYSFIEELKQYNNQ